MSLYKKSKRRAIKEAKEKLNSIISQINNVAETDWANEEVRKSVKNTLCDFKKKKKKHKLEYLIQDLNDIDCLIDYCSDDVVENTAFTLLCLQTYLPIVLDTISSKVTCT